MDLAHGRRSRPIVDWLTGSSYEMVLLVRFYFGIIVFLLSSLPFRHVTRYFLFRRD